MTPKAYTFEQGEGRQKTNMLEYFVRTYDKKLQWPTQPLLEVVQKRGTIYLPPELCTLIGVPTDIRNNFMAMNDIRKSAQQKPD